MSAGARPGAAVITGAGVVSAFGVGRELFLDALARGGSAVGPIRSFDASALPTRVAGEVPPGADVGAGALLAEAGLEGGAGRDRKVGFALLAAAEAWRQAGCGAAERAAPLCLALGLEQAFLDDFAPLWDRGAGLIDWTREASAGLPPVRFRSPVDLGARAVRRLLGLRGSTAINVSACAAGTLAVAHAASLIARGAADVVVCGGADSMVNPLGIGGFARLEAPSPRAEPDACRPFDRRRDGLAIGEGAALFVVEAEGRARARGARPLARILGWASTQDGHRATAPRPDGAAAARAMRQAIEHAGVGVDRVGYVNAHGTGTPLNDVAEARAIRQVFGARSDDLPVSSIKGAVGHLMAAAGAIEIAAALLAFERDCLPGTAHHREPDPECCVAVIGETPRPARVEVVASNSFGFGGQNATVVLGRA